MRSKYQSEEDLKNEREVVAVLCDAWKCKAEKTPDFYPVDWSFQKDREVKALGEIKCRDKSYQTYMLSLHKFSEMCKQSETTGVPYLLIVRWPEKDVKVIRWVSVKRDIVLRVIHGGRKDRGDPQDMEPMVEIDLAAFKLITQ